MCTTNNGCTGLTSVTIPNSVTSIGHSAFRNCSGLTSVTIPNSVTSIGSYAFYDCKNFPVENGLRYADCYLIEVVDKNLSTYDIKSGTRFIGDGAFYDCLELTSITIPNSVTSIGTSAFEGCSGLTSVTIPKSLTNIGRNAFSGCQNVKELIYADGCTTTLPTNLTSITSIIIPNSVTNIANSAFSGCTGLTNATIPNSVTSIGSSAFSDCTGLTSVTIPNSVTSIGESAFSNCSNVKELIYADGCTTALRTYLTKITSVTIPNSVTNIAGSAFYDCSGLTNVTIPNSVTSIGGSAFSGCSSLTSITIPNSVTYLVDDAFDGCINLPVENGLRYADWLLFEVVDKNLTFYDIKPETRLIRGGVFNNCYNLTNIKIPNGVTSIGGSTFNNCSGLTNVILPNSITSIGSYAFDNCLSLTNITIPSSVTFIGNDAFYNCYNLNTINVLAETPPSMGGLSTFKCDKYSVRDEYDIYTYANLHVPMGCKDIYSAAYEWRYFNKIKEDMEMDGKVFYARLAVKQGTVGYTEHNVKADEPYTVYIGSIGNHPINTVTFNGKDVTNELHNGYYTTPEIKSNSTLSVTYETEINGVKSQTLKDVKVYGDEGAINVTDIEEPTSVQIFNAEGKLIERESGVFGRSRYYVPEGEVYIVKVGQRTFKLAM